jgi:hypothetical protein
VPDSIDGRSGRSEWGAGGNRGTMAVIQTCGGGGGDQLRTATAPPPRMPAPTNTPQWTIMDDYGLICE